MPPKAWWALDATIAGYAHEGGRGIIICVNKWDEVDGHRAARRKTSSSRRSAISSSSWTTRPVVFISAKTGAGVQQLFSADPRSV